MRERSSSGGPKVFSSLRGRRVLVVEDEYLLAEDLREGLEGQGAEVLGPVPIVAEALALLRQGPAPDFAILDINLQGEMVYPVADLLRAQGIPFLFATGYDAWAIPEAYADVPRTEKPVDLTQATGRLLT
jgi:CheY-like chemotaxis protein